MHDYTRDDSFNTDPDDFVIGAVVAPAKSADDIEKENLFSAVPPGEHLLTVLDFPNPPEEKPYKVMVNGRLELFTAHSIRVRFCLPGNPKCTVTDYFLLPPSDPKQLNAYYNGVPEGKKQAGWAASKFVHFINRLGYSFPPGGVLPEAAQRLGNWKGRAIYATVEPGRRYTDSQGNQKPGSNQIKTWSYRPAQQGAGGAGGVGPAKQPAHLQTGQDGGGHAAQVRQATVTPTRQAVSAGLDNL
jgi:hypothetical protein